MGESVDENSLMNVWLTVIVSHPQYLSVDLKRKELISRGSVLYEVSAGCACLLATRPNVRGRGGAATPPKAGLRGLAHVKKIVG